MSMWNSSASVLSVNPVKILILGMVIFSGGCAKTSPEFQRMESPPSDNLTADSIFESTFLKHGGDNLTALNDLNIAIDGDWHFLITKIQPLVTDAKYRQKSEERILPKDRLYTALYTGEAGQKQVLRTPTQISVAYDGQLISDDKKQAAAALTADAFYLFALGPLALNERVEKWQRLSDVKEDGKTYYRINGQLKPGIGLSEQDYITLWVEQQSRLTYRLHITLEGFETTKGAHVDTTYLGYTTIGGFTFATHFFERVRGPISIDAHEWWYTGIDINRGLTKNDVKLEAWSKKASEPAKALIAVRE